MIAFVRGVIAAATAAGSISIVFSSTSTRIGRAFAYRIASTVAKNVCDTVMTSSPLDTPHARIASWRASVPLPTPIECLVPMYDANSWAKALTFGPMVSCMLSSTSSMAARTSSRIVAYCAFRSTRGISCVATAVITLRSPSYLHPLRKILEPRVGMRVDADKAREIADVLFELHGWIPGPHRPRRHCVAHDASRADERVLADLHTGKDRAVASDTRPATDDAAPHAFEIRRTLRVRVVGEDHVRAEKDVVVDRRELEKATGVHAHARTDAIAEFERRVRSDRDVVADDVVFADRRALSGLQARTDTRAGVDGRERTDHRAGTDDELELALLLAARRTTQDRVLADDAFLTQADVRPHDRGRMHGRLHAGAHARTASSR